jgi:peptidoglycan/xylan/chitin deacetylase (PgdA/CDA1 family)
MLERGLDALDRITGKRPRGYRSPAWELSKSTFRLLEEYGFEYDASQLGRIGHTGFTIRSGKPRSSKSLPPGSCLTQATS